jgi:hypothetical protein
MGSMPPTCCVQGLGFRVQLGWGLLNFDQSIPAPKLALKSKRGLLIGAKETYQGPKETGKGAKEAC